MENDRDANAKTDDAIQAVNGLFALFAEAGTPVETADDLVEAVDSLMGEIVAASLFLSSDHFSRSPDMLRNISKQVSADKNVPQSVLDGFRSLANRIETTRQAQQVYGNHLLTQMSK